jgi:hypothetical protein
LSSVGPPELHPLDRVGEVEDVVGGVLYLESAPFVTGRSCTSTAARAPDTEGKALVSRCVENRPPLTRWM